ncbi:MAG TPA: trans-aconitate 2-methyltransferase [Terriglobales bacterium]|nr:trans-aconitate 2-methyltransferase [Terriglobales bacterium]
MSNHPSWDPGQYRRYADERSRPFFELVGRIGAERPGHVVDLGCGDGALTATLVARWPDATVEGVDRSPEMIAAAEPRTIPGRLGFAIGDVRDWRPDAAVDVLVSNATLQWVPEHARLLEGWADALAPGGWLAFQVPGNDRAPSHAILDELRSAPRWRDRLASAAPGPRVLEPGEYLARLADRGCEVDAWETTYQHVLQGPDAVLEWVKGTALRPVLSALDTEEGDAFLAAYAARLREAYPARPIGTVMPFRRIFVVAARCG